MTILDEQIRDALVKVGVSWYPFYISDGKAVFPTTIETPACIQEVEDKWRYTDKGTILRTINFYMFDKRKKEVSVTNVRDDIMVKQEAITQFIIQFLQEMNKSIFKVRLIGEPFKTHDNMPILDVGQDFVLTIEYAPCQI